MKVAVVGYGLEGADSYAYFTARGDEVTVCDQNTELEVPAGAQSQLGDNYLQDLDRFDLIVRTAGMHPRLILEPNPGVADKITTQLNEFMRVCPSRQTIAITGTKGKGTTTTLIAKMLEAAGKSVALGGNIGIPLLSLLPTITPDTWVVLELSSFQLMDMHYAPHIGVCLMIVPEHLNWHADMAEYTTAKAQLFAHQTADDIAIYFSDNDLSQQIASAGKGQKIPYYRQPGAWVNDSTLTIADTPICRTDELKLLGAHNWQNACAALTAFWQVDQNAAAARSVLTSFSGLPYHLEFIRELDGVSYYNDSFGTTPETASVAIQAFEQPKVLILGGGYKGVPFDELASVVQTGNVRQVILTGNTEYGDDAKRQASAPQLEQALRAQGFAAITTLVRPGGATMPEIVQAARAAAQPGDIVLLSTASTSFDMFENYKQRGEAFTASVQALI